MRNKRLTKPEPLASVYAVCDLSTHSVKYVHAELVAGIKFRHKSDSPTRRSVFTTMAMLF
jgi:hypothetical protein